MSTDLNNKLAQLENLFTELNAHGMDGRSGAVWPVIIKKHHNSRENTTSYEYDYPYSYFDNLQRQKRFFLPYLKSKSDRAIFTKLVIDKHMVGEIDIYMYHFGMFLLYGNSGAYLEREDLTDTAIGKRRAKFVETLPTSRFMNTDDFLSAMWAYQIERRDLDIGEYVKNPSMNKVRILFTNDQFSSWTGRSYSDDVTWVEPMSGKLDLESRTYSEKTDPMAPEKIPEGWVQGEIILGHEGSSSGLRHFVNSSQVYAGSAIQVKFGTGWIEGRYEWSFDEKSKIRVHCHEDVFFINEGHQVRIRG